MTKKEETNGGRERKNTDQLTISSCVIPKSERTLEVLFVCVCVCACVSTP